MIAGATTFFVMASGAPKLDESLLKDPLSSKVYDMNGNKIYEFGAEKRTYVPLEQIPDNLKNAVLAVEDARFYEHHGLDVIRLGGAVLANFKEGFGAEGASTISQQVIKNSFFEEGQKKLTRKAQELWLAFQLERKYSKDEILEMYLNKIYYGVGNTYGVAKAAEIYFDKPLDELELHEAAFIAGLGQNPGIYNPFVHPEAAEKRRNIVLTLMVRHDFISKEEADAAKKVPIETSIVESEEQSHPIDSFMDQVKRELKESDIDVYNAGVKIYTTFDPEAQAHIDSLLANKNPDVQFPNDKLQAGIAVVDTKTGEIRALGGGRNQAQNSRRNFALESDNQPGSTIKPILDYGPAIEYLKWSTYQQIKDEPYTYSDKTPINNFDRKYMGQITARVALAHSRNIPALKAFQEVGVTKATEFANGLGITFDERINEAYSIGGMHGGISPLEMAGAYATFGNEGNFIKPHAVNKIVFPDNREVVLAPEPETAMSEATAFMVTDMLKSVMDFGSGRRYDVSGLQIAGKTGTTNYSAKDIKNYNIPSGGVPDIWFSGYTPSYTVSIWTGYSNNQEAVLPAEQSLALKLFRDIITNLSEGKEAEDFVMPKSVVKVGVEKGSNPAKLPSEFTPKDEIVYEYFIKGTEPTQVSDKYDKLTTPSNLEVLYDQETNQIKLSWAYAEGELERNSFEISVSIDEGPAKVLTTTKELTYTVPEAIPGAIYKFTVTAVNDENPEQRSDPATNTIEVPEPAEEEIEIPLPPVTPPGNGNGNDNGNGGENDGNNNGEGNGEGSGDGNGDEEVPVFPPVPPGNGDRQ
ncbi:PBP1A family penicillin-binding protein [Bacillus timonensis]|uniref:PBP1A family penicillin-binding protein n=1 Tax=Bacillus timonensis TaxID=1033734 RepID=UPI00028870F7|nr:PBP1A family penicillin-binding protein [Bacillus timonensis]